METNIAALQELIKNDFRGNKSWFAEEIGIDRSYLNEILNKRKSASSNKLCLSIINGKSQRKIIYALLTTFILYAIMSQ